MKPSILFHEAYRSLSANKLRSFLATLGIVIGVSSVVLMISVGSGSKRAIQESVERLGSNLLIVTPGGRLVGGVRSMESSFLTMDDMRAISSLQSVSGIAAATRPRSYQVSAGSNNWNTQVIGANAEFFPIRDWPIEHGVVFSDEDSRLARRVALIGATVAQKLFAFEPAVGRNFKIGELSFVVIGVLQAKGQGFDGRDQDDAVYVPFSTAQSKLFGNIRPDAVQMMYVKALDKEWIDAAIEEITTTLRQRKKLRDSDENTFTVRNLAAVSQVASETAGALSMLLGAIASISLVVGGIGIMNIMLVTVAERTREIGLRKALGASNELILLQFLIEAVIIAGLGSVSGLAVGTLIGLVIELGFSIPTETSMWSVILAVGVTVGVGVLSGLYPARKAAALEPVEALRSIGS